MTRRASWGGSRERAVKRERLKRVTNTGPPTRDNRNAPAGPPTHENRNAPWFVGSVACGSFTEAAESENSLQIVGIGGHFDSPIPSAVAVASRLSLNSWLHERGPGHERRLRGALILIEGVPSQRVCLSHTPFRLSHRSQGAP